MEPYYICDCPTCGQPKYSTAKLKPSKALIEKRKQWECYHCSKLSSKNPAYGKQKTDDWIQKTSASLQGKNTWSRDRTLTNEHKENISIGLYRAYQTNKRQADGYLISLGMDSGLAKGLTRKEYNKLISDKKQYYNEVRKITNRQDIKSLEHNEKRGKSKKGTDNFQLDHIIPISYGFLNNIDPLIIGDISNLRFIPWQENILRNKKNKLI